MKIYFAFVFIVFALFIAPADAANREDILDALASRQYDRAYTLSRAGGDRFVVALATWYYLRHGSEIAEYKTYERFLREHRDWPEKDTVKRRMEIAFLNLDPSRQDIIRWFKTWPPLSSRANLIWLDAHGKLDKQSLQNLWVESDLSLREENRILSHYGRKLTSTAHTNRIDRLLWEGQTAAAERMLRLVPADIQKLSRARMQLRRGITAGIDGLINAVPGRLAYHPGLLYERMRFRSERGNYEGVEEILLQAPASLPYAHLWWNDQKRVIRDAIEAGQHSKAKLLLDKHSQVEALPRVEAEWMRGWLYYHFLKQPAVAAPAFENIYHTAKMPISRSRGAYWAGRAHEAAKTPQTARDWYQQAALFPTTFFGQLAHQHLKPGTPLPLPTFFPPADKDIEGFTKTTPLAAQFRSFVRSGHAGLLMPMILDELQQHSEPEYAARFAALARYENQYPIAIKIAQEALNKGLYVSELYPLLSTPDNIGIEPAFALAIIRQESRFDRMARSPADARGLMQLLPSTARKVAATQGLSYSLEMLYQPHYNMTLGTHFMGDLMQRFRGSMILSIAGYNAGPGRSDQWLDRFGSLSRKDYRQNIQWMEMIPFGETRDYVQRVLENYHVYKHLLSTTKPPLNAEETLIRFGY